MSASPGSLPDFKIMTLFGCGALLLIGVGCTINDLIYQDRYKGFNSKSPTMNNHSVSCRRIVPFILFHKLVSIMCRWLWAQWMEYKWYVEYKWKSHHGRKVVTESCIGGMKETQEMIDFAAKHNIKADVEVILIDFVNTAMGRLVKVNDRYKFAINIGNTLKPTNS